jgi:hypothetical protein
MIIFDEGEHLYSLASLALIAKPFTRRDRGCIGLEILLGYYSPFRIEANEVHIPKRGQ